MRNEDALLQCLLRIDESLQRAADCSEVALELQQESLQIMRANHEANKKLQETVSREARRG